MLKASCLPVSFSVFSSLSLSHCSSVHSPSVCVCQSVSLSFSIFDYFAARSSNHHLSVYVSVSLFCFLSLSSIIWLPAHLIISYLCMCLTGVSLFHSLSLSSVIWLPALLIISYLSICACVCQSVSLSLCL